MTLLQVRDVEKTFHVSGRRVHALRGVSFDMQAGECVAIVGETGSGKSTLGKIVLGLLQPDSGSVRIDGTEWSGKWGRSGEKHRLDVQPVFQNPRQSLNPRRTVQQTLAQALNVRGGGASDTASLLERVGLTPPERYAGRMPRELSGGEQQRVAIARALAVRPSLLVADEPTSALDVSLRAGVLNVFAEVQREDVGILLITHDILVARAMSSWIVVMKDGQVVESGPTASIVGGNANDDYTKRLLASVPGLDTMENVK